VVAVDPDDDTIRRYVVRHYRYDPDRHERRHVIVAAFDNEFEWDACMDATEAALRAGWDTSEAVDPREHVSGTVYEPGYRRLQQNGRLLRRAAEHGVWPLNWQDLELPANVGIRSDLFLRLLLETSCRIGLWCGRSRGIWLVST
jgi:hypothetical protein